MTAYGQGSGHGPQERREQLRRGLEDVRARIARACEAAERAPEDLTLVVVTKFFPASDVAHLVALGVRDIGESRDQEASAKMDELGELGVPRDALTVHMIGQVQTNKAGSVARYADVVHSVDRDRLVAALDKGAQKAERDLDVLLQVSLDGDTARGGVPLDGVAALAQDVAAAQRLRLRGVMAVAPKEADPERAFATLRECAERLRADHPTATVMSAGMSGDLEAAIAQGATHLRVGSAILGRRDYTR